MSESTTVDLTACAACGFYLIHARRCELYEPPTKEDEDAEWRAPASAVEALEHFELWVQPWSSCFDCKVDLYCGKQYGAYSMFYRDIKHHPGCMVRWLHRKLVADAQAEAA